MIRGMVRLIGVAAVLTAAVLVPVVGTTPTSTAQASIASLDVSQFDAGNIISDAVFFDALSMDEAAIQSFLVAKGTACDVGSLCLKNYRVTTTDRAADEFCRGYAGRADEPASRIIAKAAASCGVSPKVLLVLLQKEQGMVTGSPTAKKYVRATGFACPDSANGGCDPAFAGLENQLYNAARQYQRYAAGHLNNYKPGMYHDILWSPNTACGTSRVFVQNQATAGLYDYTPYRPNQASLNARGGTGDDCSSYGNRNFWLYFTDWFGSTQSPGAAAIIAAHEAAGGNAGWLGKPTSGYMCGLVRGGCFQTFEGGSMYWSPASGAHAVRGAIFAGWGAQSWEKGWLGYPTSEEKCGLKGGGCAQQFQGAILYYTLKTGVQPVEPQLLKGYAAQGYENGSFGYPLARQKCGLVNGGCLQKFQGGTVYVSRSTAAHAVRGDIYRVWASQGYEKGPLGYPAGEQTCGSTANGCVQQFQKGTLAWSPGGGAQLVGGTIGKTWLAAGGPKGSPWGPPTGPQICGLVRSGCFQAFRTGMVYTSPASGTHVVRGAIFGVWGSRGYEKGALGYPISDEKCTNGQCVQSFEKAILFWSAKSGPQYLQGSIGKYWLRVGGVAAPVGTPVGPRICGLVKGGCFQGFTKGFVYLSPTTGSHTVLTGPIRDAWGRNGWEKGRLGYPVADQQTVSGGVRQRFQGGTLTYSATTKKVTLT